MMIQYVPYVLCVIATVPHKSNVISDMQSTHTHGTVQNSASLLERMNIAEQSTVAFIMIGFYVHLVLCPARVTSSSSPTGSIHPNAATDLPTPQPSFNRITI